MAADSGNEIDVSRSAQYGRWGRQLLLNLSYMALVSFCFYVLCTIYYFLTFCTLFRMRDISSHVLTTKTRFFRP